MDPYFAEFVPLTKNMELKAHMHSGFEFLYVLDGELELRHGDQVATLERGDSVYFDASRPHSYHCAGKSPAGAIIVTMQQPVPTAPKAAAKTVAEGQVKPNGADGASQ
jgi:quercetin dioxygenase-like cupin family protein